MTSTSQAEGSMSLLIMLMIEQGKIFSASCMADQHWMAYALILYSETQFSSTTPSFAVVIMALPGTSFVLGR